LMDEDGIVVPRFRKRAEEWYASLQSLCGWNSRYWEQRASSAMRSGDRKRARDFAATGVGIERHWQPLTTYARVLIDSAENDQGLQRLQREKLFKEGLAFLDEAINTAASSDRHDVHPYHLLVEGAVRVSRRLTGGVPDWLRDLIRAHASNAQKHFGHLSEIRKPLAELHKAGIL